MPNDSIQAAFHGFKQKLDSFKTKLEFQQLLAESLTAEFESLTSEFESLKQQFDATSPGFESTSNKSESTSFIFGATLHNNESILHESVSSSPEFGSTSNKNESTSFDIESSSRKIDASSPGNDALMPAQELAALIERSVNESLKIYYALPNIPNRLAEIVLALHERKKLSVAQMRQITGVSRNSLVRDIQVLKRLGWIEFHGSRKNGYFTLTDSFQNSELNKIRLLSACHI